MRKITRRQFLRSLSRLFHLAFKALGSVVSYLDFMRGFIEKEDGFPKRIARFTRLPFVFFFLVLLSLGSYNGAYDGRSDEGRFFLLEKKLGGSSEWVEVEAYRFWLLVVERYLFAFLFLLMVGLLVWIGAKGFIAWRKAGVSKLPSGVSKRKTSAGE
ncbi:hypothetical protein TRP8649_03849 [Pelagimonas phthalicica]|uniref:Uncharacterized protein n=1 Tax=Pelagimonas phthalicica TaxID=1037362 RepID=A0A238JG99_9RHOB|nr:hypothetical protein CLV87_4304 [Pelagimonas phthalicica]SMX29710.1 hypothetical protein TRP8649_03849 [Pelagimonas phthalicica]